MNKQAWEAQRRPDTLLESLSVLGENLTEDSDDKYALVAEGEQCVSPLTA